MLIGVPKEIKDNEFRVGMTPAVVSGADPPRSLRCWWRLRAGLGSGLTDDEYREAGATIVDDADEIFARAEMVVKVKEPQAAERKMLRSGQIAVHLSASRAGPAADRGPDQERRDLHRL